MYNSSTIKTSLIGLIGWRQNIDQNGDQLTEMLTSESGLFFNDEHPLLTMENLISIAPQFDRLSYPDWSATEAYVVGNIRRNGGINYECILAHTNQAPPNSTYWRVYDDLTKWLKEKTESGIIKGIDLWLQTKVNRKSAKNLLERNQLFNTSSRIDETITKKGNFVGHGITPLRALGVVSQINEISLHFDADQSGIIIKLFRSDDKQPIQQTTLNYTGNGSVQWFSLTDFKMDRPGTYFIGYDEDSISVNAVNGIRNYNYSDKGLNCYPFAKYLDIISFSADSDGSELWDISQNSYTLDSNYGINLKFHVECDYTDFLVEQRKLLKTVISKSVAIELLRYMAYNPEVNVNRNAANVSKEEILYEIDGDTSGPRPNGLRHQLEEAVKAVTIDFEGVDKKCLPCRKMGIDVIPIGMVNQRLY